MLALGLALRLTPWSQVFTPQGVRFVDADPYYHVLRAQRIVEDYPRIPWHDQGMNFPEGADILWPPLFDFLIATPAVLIGGAGAPIEVTETVGAWLSPLIGLVSLPLLAWLGAVLMGPRAGLAAALACAVLPAHLGFSLLGRPDQHVAETLLSVWIFLAFVAGWRQAGGTSRPWKAWVLLGLGITLAFWNWMGSGLYLLFLVAFTAIWHVVAPPDDAVAVRSAEAVAWGGSFAAVLLAGSMLLWSREGSIRDMGLVGLTGFHLVLVILTAAFGFLLVGSKRAMPQSSRARRCGLVVVAAGIPLAAALLLLPELRQGLAHGWAFLGRTNPWYRNIDEFRPLFFSGVKPFSAEIAKAVGNYGLGLFLMPALLPLFIRRWREEVRERPAIFFLAFWGCVLLFLAVARFRFANYFVIPLSLWLGFGWLELDAALRGRGLKKNWSRALAAGALLGTLLPAAPAIRGLSQIHGLPPEDLVSALEFLETREAPTGREAVLADLDLGHFISYFSRKPVLVNSFGTDLGRGAMEDAAAVFSARTERSVDGVLARRRIGFLFLHDPPNTVFSFAGFAALGEELPLNLTRNWRKGSQLNVGRGFMDLVVPRLYYFDGVSRPDEGSPTIESLRLVYEGGSEARVLGTVVRRYKIFEAVPGAEVRVLSQTGRVVTVETILQTHHGRRFRWQSSKVTGGEGDATLRLPYATGRNGSVSALGPYVVSDGWHETRVSLTEQEIWQGTRLEVALSSGGST